MRSQLLDEIYESHRVIYPDCIPDRPISPPESRLSKVLNCAHVWLDLGELGNQEVMVTYRKGIGQVLVESVSLKGFSIKNMLRADTIEVLGQEILDKLEA